jgi:hypothetical protein
MLHPNQRTHLQGLVTEWRSRHKGAVDPVWDLIIDAEGLLTDQPEQLFLRDMKDDPQAYYLFLTKGHDRYREDGSYVPKDKT